MGTKAKQTKQEHVDALARAIESIGLVDTLYLVGGLIRTGAYVRAEKGDRLAALRLHEDAATVDKAATFIEQRRKGKRTPASKG